MSARGLHAKRKTCRMNPFQHLARKIICLAFRVGIPAFELFHSRARLRRRTMELASYPEGTLGREIGDCLQRFGLRPLPFFESHDLKHVLLGYGMTPVDEIRLQAFVIGNGNRSFPTVLLFCVGALLLPEEWPSVRQAFRRGKATMAISSWSVGSHGLEQAHLLRQLLAVRVRTAGSQCRYPVTRDRTARGIAQESLQRANTAYTQPFTR